MLNSGVPFRKIDGSILVEGDYNEGVKNDEKRQTAGFGRNVGLDADNDFGCLCQRGVIWYYPNFDAPALVGGNN